MNEGIDRGDLTSQFEEEETIYKVLIRERSYSWLENNYTLDGERLRSLGIYFALKVYKEKWERMRRWITSILFGVVGLLFVTSCILFAFASSINSRVQNIPFSILYAVGFISIISAGLWTYDMIERFRSSWNELVENSLMLEWKTPDFACHTEQLLRWVDTMAEYRQVGDPLSKIHLLQASGIESHTYSVPESVSRYCITSLNDLTYLVKGHEEGIRPEFTRDEIDGIKKSIVKYHNLATMFGITDKSLKEFYEQAGELVRQKKEEAQEEDRIAEQADRIVKQLQK